MLRNTSMPMSKDHAPTVCFQCESFGTCGTFVSSFRSTVEADVAKPHLAGVNQDIWSSPSRLVTGIKPPENTSCDMTATTSNGMICSLVFATDDNTNPSIAEATVVAAMSAYNSSGALPSSTAPLVGPPLPISAITVTMPD